MCIKFIENSLSFGEISMVQDMGETTSDNPPKLRSFCTKIIKHVIFSKVQSLCHKKCVSHKHLAH